MEKSSQPRTRHEDEWLHYGHPRMPMSERAKIFLPFDPLKGFRAELACRERLVVERHDNGPKRHDSVDRTAETDG